MSNPAVQSQSTTIGASTAETTIVTAGAGRRNLYGLIITSLNNAAATLTLRDSTGGTTRMVIDYPNTAAFQNPFVMALDVPLQQGSPAQNWTIQASASVTGYKITALFSEEF